MNTRDNILNCYNKVADDYAAERWDELYSKHFDMMVLKEFAAGNKGRGLCADFGCGPGQTTKYLYDHGLINIIGIDLAPAMIRAARRLFHPIQFETGDLLNIAYPAEHFTSAVAFYAIVHFSIDEVRSCFHGINRVLRTGGQFLFSFHAGEEVVHFDKAHDKEVDVDLMFFQSEEIIGLLDATGFRTIDATERRPYEEEYQSRRAYIWAEKK